MRKLIFVLCAVVMCANSAMGWGRLGHAAIVGVAQRHLTEKAKANIAKYIDYDLKKDAVWMDEHRRDEGIAYTSSWHTYSTFENHEYDPNPRLYKGDCVLALNVADYNLKRYKTLTDSAVVFNIRMLIHFVGDLHCPTHGYPHNSNYKWSCEFKGKKQKTFHSIYDKMPSWIWPKTKADVVAEKIDNCSKGEIKKIQKGDVYTWVYEICEDSAAILEWNPIDTYNLNPETVELSRDLVNTQMRNAGYRLAYLLNKYFDK